MRCLPKCCNLAIYLTQRVRKLSSARALSSAEGNVLNSSFMTLSFFYHKELFDTIVKFGSVANLRKPVGNLEKVIHLHNL